MVTYELINDGFVLIKDGLVVLRQTDEPDGAPGTPLTPARAKELALGMIDYITAAEAAAAQG